MSVRYSEWTAEQDDALVSMLNSGLSSSRIASHFGKSRSAVCGRIYRLRDKGQAGAPPSLKGTKADSVRVGKPKSPGLAFVPLIRQRLEQGATDREIASEIGLHAEDVRYARRVSGLPGTVRPAGPPANAEEVARLVAEGKSDPQIADALGVTIWQARNTRRRLKLGAPATPKPGHKPVTNIVKGDSGGKVGKVFTEGFMGQRSRLGLLDMPFSGACRFPIDQTDGPVRYCGDHADDGKSYCAHHAARCYTDAPPAKPLKPSHVYTARR
jgi:hypothetical protein